MLEQTQENHKLPRAAHRVFSARAAANLHRRIRNYFCGAAVEKLTVAVDLFDTMKHNSAFAFFAPVGKNDLPRQFSFF